MNILIITLLSLFPSITLVNSARIFALLPFQVRSHNAVFQKYVEGLCARGHELIVASPFAPPQKLKNYTFIDTSSVIPNFSDSLGVNREVATPSIYRHFSFFSDFEETHCRSILDHPDVRRLYNSEEKPFDAIIVQSYYIPCYLPLGVIKKVPIVWFLAPSRMFAADLAIGNVQNPSYVPSLLRTYEFPPSTNTTFLNRCWNSYYYLVTYFYHYFLFFPRTRNLCEEYFGRWNINCDVNELFKSVDLVLTYSHSALHPRPTVPNHVQVGGVHIEPAKPLPHDIQHFLDNSSEDVVFVSFGSLVKISSSEDQLIDALLEAFSACQCQILWKSDLDENTSNRIIPKNVFVKKWFPQRDILAHKKVKAFVSHGGLYSMYEAIYTATPVIGIPLFFDQSDNVRRMAELDVGIHLNYDRITDLKMAIKEILENSKYLENMNRLSQIMQEQQLPLLDKAIYWIEYAIRNNGTAHLRTVGADLPLYQYLLLDVFSVTVTLTVVTFYIFQKIIRGGIRFLRKMISRENINKKLQ